MAKGEPVEEVLTKLGEDVQSGKLKQQDVMKFKTKIKGQSLESSVSRLSIDQAMAVWRVATDEEKRKIVPLIFKKYRNLKDPRDRQEYASAMEKISNDLSKIYNLE
jgi:catalase